MAREIASASAAKAYSLLDTQETGRNGDKAMTDRRVKILYMEDIKDILEVWLDFIRKNWGAECEGARSREKALKLINEDGFKPDLVIFDRGILLYDNEQVDDKKAGDRL